MKELVMILQKARIFLLSALWQFSWWQSGRDWFKV